MTTLSLRRLAYLSLVAFSIFAIISLYPIQQTMWAVWAALFFSLMIINSGFIQRMKVLLATALICLAAICLADFAGSSIYLLASYLFVITAIAIYLSQQYPQHAYPIFIVNLFAILSSYHLSLASDLSSFEKIIAFSLGVLVVLIWQIIFSYGFLQSEWRATVLAAIARLKRLNQEIFACLLHAEYSENVYIFERRLHAQKEKFMQCVVALSGMKKTALEATVLRKLNRLYDIMLDYAQLRRRVGDYTVLGVCSIELTEIEKEISILFSTVSKRMSNKVYHVNTDALAQSIQRLESNYQQALQVTARDPLVFLLFIASLKAFCEEVANFD